MEREHELERAARAAYERCRAREHRLPEAPQDSQRPGLLELVLRQVERLREAQAAVPARRSDQQ